MLRLARGRAGQTDGGADRTRLAVGLVLSAALCFVATDGAAKYLSAGMSAPQILWIRNGVVLAILIPLVWRAGGRRRLRTGRPFLHVLRGLLLLGAGLLFVSALGNLPLELCTALTYVAPLFVTALSIPVLRERVGVRRWAAVGVGFLGVLVIVRPVGAGFLWVMFLPVLSALCWSMVLVVTRLMRSSERPLTVLLYSSVVGWVVSGPFAWMSWRTPGDTDWLLLIGIGLGYALGQYLTIRAFMLASPSLLAPFAYSSMIWAVLIGATVFGTFPDLATVVGTAVLIGAGLYVWHREIVRGRERVRGPPEQSPRAPR